jgi:hypothetical protein
MGVGTGAVTGQRFSARSSLVMEREEALSVHPQSAEIANSSNSCPTSALREEKAPSGEALIEARAPPDVLQDRNGSMKRTHFTSDDRGLQVK